MSYIHKDYNSEDAEIRMSNSDNDDDLRFANITSARLTSSGTSITGESPIIAIRIILGHSEVILYT